MFKNYKDDNLCCLFIIIIILKRINVTGERLFLERDYKSQQLRAKQKYCIFQKSKFYREISIFLLFIKLELMLPQRHTAPKQTKRKTPGELRGPKALCGPSTPPPSFCVFSCTSWISPHTPPREHLH